MENVGLIIALIKALAPDLGDNVAQAVSDYMDEHGVDLSDYAKVDGSYLSLTSGNAEQLVSTVGVENKTPYLFRTTGGSADVGDRVKLSEITGGTVAWNQLVQNNGELENDNSVTKNGVTYTYTAPNKVTIQTGENGSTAQGGVVFSNLPAFIDGHKYFIGKCPAGANKNNKYFLNVTGKEISNQIDQEGYTIRQISTGSGSTNSIGIYVRSGVVLTTPVTFEFIVIDLTAMFGSTIADYLYTLESGTPGAGIAKLKSWGFCTKPYYAYNAGSLLSVKTSAHKTVGFNQWDEIAESGGLYTSTGGPSVNDNNYRSKNYIPVVPDTSYYVKNSAHAITSGKSIRLYFYDANKGFITSPSGSNNSRTFTTPANAYYMKFIVAEALSNFDNTICINLHWDGERDGEYEPYEEHSYPLDSDLELRGIPKLDANNNLYYDGDSYEADGTVTRKYATRAYEAGDATDGSTMITDGTDTVYKLTTPTTESADPYQETQVCNDFGTEELVDSRTVPMPVGANALYQANLRAKLEMAPDSPDGDGDYIVRQTDGLNEYALLEKELPTAPAEDGTYSLKCTVADGTATLSWVSDS